MLFMWEHMAFVSTILISKGAMWWVNRMFEGQFVFGKSYPGIVSAGVVLVSVLFVLHGADPIKQSTQEAIEILHRDGIRIVMLTGDSRTTAEAVARCLGIDRVEAEVLPEQKVGVVKRLQSEGWVVAMAGDGVNDAPALAKHRSVSQWVPAPMSPSKAPT